jgi:hypothetical protein
MSRKTFTEPMTCPPETTGEEVKTMGKVVPSLRVKTSSPRTVAPERTTPSIGHCSAG